MKAKPGDVHMNRGTERHGPFVTEEDCKTWLTDDTSILAYGIRKSDYATQSEQVKIYIKVIKQVCSMEDCPKEFSDFFTTELGIVPDVEPLRDYIRLIDKTTRKDLGYPKLLFSDFDKNKHHSKEKKIDSIENTRTEQSCVSRAPALEGPGAEGCDTLPNITSRAYGIQGETISQTTGDGDKDTFKIEAGL